MCVQSSSRQCEARQHDYDAIGSGERIYTKVKTAKPVDLARIGFCFLEAGQVYDMI